MLVDAAPLRNQERVAGRIASGRAWVRRFDDAVYSLQSSLSIVTRLAHERTLCALISDGTLSSIVDHPDQAVMRAELKMRSANWPLLYPCLIVSGRAERMS